MLPEVEAHGSKVNDDGGIFKDLDANELATFTVTKFAKCAAAYLRTPLQIPPETTILREAPCGVKTAITISISSRVTRHKVCNWSA